MRVLISTILLCCIFTGAFATQNKKQVKIRVQAATGNFDETTVFFDQGVSSVYANTEDLIKTIHPLPGVPILYSLSSDSKDLSTNGYSTLSQSEVVALGVKVDTDGVYKFATSLIDKFDATSIIRLEDKLNNTFTDLRANFYQANILSSESETGRFFLHVSYPAKFTTVTAGCSNNDGIIEVEQDNSVQWDLCELYDANNTLVGSFTNINGQFNFPSLTEGNYTMNLVYGAYVTSKQLHVNSHAITANINVSQVTAYTGEDIDFHAIYQNANHFEWNFGDGTLIYGIANPTISYYESGTYTVTLKCSNDFGCSTNADATVTISQAQVSGVNDVTAKEALIVAAGNNLNINLNDEVNKDASVKVFNVLGESVYSNKLNNQISNISLNEIPSSYYIVSVNNNNKISTKRIYIGN